MPNASEVENKNKNRHEGIEKVLAGRIILKRLTRPVQASLVFVCVVAIGAFCWVSFIPTSTPPVLDSFRVFDVNRSLNTTIDLDVPLTTPVSTKEQRIAANKRKRRRQHQRRRRYVVDLKAEANSWKEQYEFTMQKLEQAEQKTSLSSNGSNGEKPELVRIKVPSKMKSEGIPVTIVLPSTYDNKDADRRYSVVYVLHGAGDDHTAWTENTDIASLGEQYKMILVIADGGSTSWYFDSPLDKEYQYETFVSQELVSYVDKNYKTRPNPRHRAVMGNSMGGHGALFLSIRHPNVFGIAVSMSGGVDIRPFPEEWDIAERIGSQAKYPERWEELTVINQARTRLTKDTTLSISLDCGMDDFFLDMNRNLHQQLIQLEVPHDYAERPGGHNWEYWEKTMHPQMLYINQQINR